VNALHARSGRTWTMRWTSCPTAWAKPPARPR
jgi:hypothetical protein